MYTNNAERQRREQVMWRRGLVLLLVLLGIVVGRPAVAQPESFGGGSGGGVRLADGDVAVDGEALIWDATANGGGGGWVAAFASGQRGSGWFRGAGAPGAIPAALAGDQYLDGETGDVYEYDGAVWAAVGQSLAGPAGADGNTIITGSGAPGAGVGVDGDIYIDTAVMDLYTRSGGAWDAGTSLVGTAGADGRTIYNGTGAPGAGLGAEGDLYYDTAAVSIYRRGAGGWEAPVSLVGSGDVTGPGGGSTDNALARFDGATGAQLADTSIIVGDDGRVTIRVNGETVFLLTGTSTDGINPNSRPGQIYLPRSANPNLRRTGLYVSLPEGNSGTQGYCGVGTYGDVDTSALDLGNGQVVGPHEMYAEGYFPEGLVNGVNWNEEGPRFQCRRLGLPVGQTSMEAGAEVVAPDTVLCELESACWVDDEGTFGYCARLQMRTEGATQATPSGRMNIQTTSGIVSEEPQTRWTFTGPGDFLPGLDGTYDIGSTATRVRDIHVDRIVFPDGTTLTTATGVGGGGGGGDPDAGAPDAGAPAPDAGVPDAAVPDAAPADAAPSPDASAGSTYDPATDPNLVGWWLADQGVTLATGNEVATWVAAAGIAGVRWDRVDASLSGPDQTAGIGPGGTTALAFNGTSDEFRLEASTGFVFNPIVADGAYTLAVVARRNCTRPDEGIAIQASGFLLGIEGGSSVWLRNQGVEAWRDGGGGAQAGPVALAINTWSAIFVECSAGVAGVSSCFIDVDGQTAGPVFTSAAAAVNTHYLGSYSGGNNLFCGDVAQYILLDDVAADQAGLLGHLAAVRDGASAVSPP